VSAHTPGPWSVPHFARMPDGCKCGYVFSEAQSGMGAICEVTHGGEDEPLEIAAANARLIAAAPDLLESARKTEAALAEHFNLPDDFDDDYAYDEMGSVLAAAYFSARDVIAKATQP
jgi:hypothetical protein